MAVDVVEIWRFEMLGGLRVVLPGGEGVTRFQTERAGALLAYLIYHRNREHPRDMLAELLWPDADRDAGRQRLRVVLHSLRRLMEPPKLAVQAGGGGLILSTRLTIGINPMAPILTDVDELQIALTALEKGEPETSDYFAEINRLYAGPLLPHLYEDWVLEERERLASRVSEAQQHNHNTPRTTTSLPASSLPAPKSSPAPQSRRRLPASLTRFWGRETEIKHLLPLLAPNAPERLITLTGLGGVGKTRLALAAAEQATQQYSPENVVFVPLNDLTDPEQIIEEIARRLTLTVRPGEDALVVIANALQEEPALFILDNLEHLLRETDKSNAAKVSDLMHDLMERLPTAKFLMTSRQRLGIEVESVFPVSPLPVPVSNLPLTDLLQNDSIRLFTDRARSVRPDFAVTAHGASAVVALCTRLEGIPLALELAAAWASLLTPTQMVERLGNSETRAERELLASRHQDRAARHQTLDTALRWSIERLPESLLQFWVRLTLFRGGWTTEAAEAICGEDQVDTIQKLAELQDRSLILSSTPESDPGIGLRFRMLEAVRQYGRKIITHEEERRLQDRHLAFFCDLAEAQALQLLGQDSIHALQILDAEYPNLTAALEWALRSDGPVSNISGLRLAAALSDYWLIRGRLREGKQYLTEIVRRIDTSKLFDNPSKVALADAWQGLGSLAQASSDLPEAYSHYEKSLQLSCDINDQKRVAAQYNNLGLIDELEGRFEEATQQHEASLALRRKNGDRRGEASSLNNLGVLKQNQRDFEAARRFYRESLKIKQELGEKRPLASAYNNLGNTSHALGDYQEAEYYQLQSLALRRELGDQLGIAASLNNLGRIAESVGNIPGARSLYAESLVVKRDIGDSLGVARSLYNLARLALDASDYFEARRNLEECLSILRQTTTNQKDISAPLYLLASLASLQKDYQRAALLCGAYDGLLIGISVTRNAEEQKEYESLCATAIQSLGVDSFTTLHRKGQKSSVEEIFRIALREEY